MAYYVEVTVMGSLGTRTSLLKRDGEAIKFDERAYAEQAVRDYEDMMNEGLGRARFFARVVEG